MSTPVAADLEDRIARLDARLGAVEAELVGRRGDARPAMPPAPGAPPPAMAGPWWGPAGPPPGPVGPPPPGIAGPPPAPGPRPGDGPAGARAPRTPVRRRAVDWSRLPVWAGGCATFVGVVLLLVLAASSDWFGPLPRVLAGAALGAGLLGTAGWLVRRTGRAGAGPSAVAGTGTTVLFASVAAATSLYELLPAVAGLLLCLAVAGVGIALADRWDSAGFAAAALVGAELALLVVAGRPDALSLGLAVAVQLGVVPTALRRAHALAPVAAAGTALHALLAGPHVGATGFGDGTGVGGGPLLAIAVVAFVLGVAGAVLGASRGARGPSVAGLVLAPLPMFAVLSAVGTAAGVAATLGMAAVAAAAGAWRVLHRVVRATAVSVSALLVAAATALLADGATLAGALLAEAVLLLAAAVWVRSRAVQLAGAWLSVVGGLTASATALGPETVVRALRDPAAEIAQGALVVAALLVLAAVAGLLAALRTGTPPVASWMAWAWLPVAAGLYGASWFIVASAQLALPGQAGFLAGHVLVTIGITGLGVASLVRGIRSQVAGRIGLALVVAALAKLVLFDLVALDGLARVAAFIGAGLVLLAVGTWYTHRVGAAGSAAAGPGDVR